MDTPIKIAQRKPRSFVAEELRIDSWDNLESYFKDIISREITTPEELIVWLSDISELEAVISDDLAWRYIRMTCDTTDSKSKESYERFVRNIDPQVKEYHNKINHRFLDVITMEGFDQKKYQVYINTTKRQIDLFCQQNIPLFTELQVQEQAFNTISGRMMVTIEGKELTLQQAAFLLNNNDRYQREQVFGKIYDRRKEDVEELDQLFSNMVTVRDEIAQNAGYGNYRDYRHDEFCRFDYTIEDCLQFHNSIASEILPVIDEILERRKKLLKVDVLKPWDLEVDPNGMLPLKPFHSTEGLIDKTIDLFYKIRPEFGEQIEVMKKLEHLDLDSRKGKAPGGYNYPLLETGVPFIFMNSVGSHKDLITMMHEGGHAIHSSLMNSLELSAFKDVPIEVAELASMTMELFSMEWWSMFYDDQSTLKRARYQQLTRVLSIFPWVAAVDKFQHWIYLHPKHTIDERNKIWVELYNSFSSEIIDWSGQEHGFAIAWQKQPHIFTLPFYYIEYAIAQLGAIALWKRFRQDPESAVSDYRKALCLGGSKTMREVYEAAGIQFDFSKEYVGELATFVKEELLTLIKHD